MSGISTFIESTTPLPESVGYARLSHLQALQVSGADALVFLHGQLTQAVEGMPQDKAHLAAYCTAKGRMLASLVMWRATAPDASPCIQALVDQSVADALVKRLRMFVLRAKVVIDTLPAQVAGIWADTPEAADAMDAWAGTALPREAWQRVDHEGVTWIAAPLGRGAPARRWWRIAAPGASVPAAGAMAHAGENLWGAQDIDAGLPWITQPVQDMLTPQLANFDLIGGVSFTKGCYPGQEVVARTHYLGKQKRRSMLARIAQEGLDAAATVGADVYLAGSVAEPLGRVVNAANGPGAMHVLFEAPMARVEGADLRLGSPSGPVLQIADLPYSLATKS